MQTLEQFDVFVEWCRTQLAQVDGMRPVGVVFLPETGGTLASLWFGINEQTVAKIVAQMAAENHMERLP
jgi:hypothetical protein